MTAVEILVAGMYAREVNWIATLCGHGLDPLYRAAAEAGMRLVDTRNEQTAGYIADAFGKLMRRPGVCAVSSGVAHVNALAGVLNAWFDSAPMLLISGAGALRTASMNHFQDVDQVAIGAPLTRFARAIDDAERVIERLDEALRCTAGPPSGPVHLTFPMGIQQTEVAREQIVQPATRTSYTTIPDLEPITAAIANSEMPLVIAGSGVWYRDEGEELMHFCERFAIPGGSDLGSGIDHTPNPRVHGRHWRGVRKPEPAARCRLHHSRGRAGL